MIAQGRMDGPEREAIMGSYWAGYHGQGLVLTAGEFQDFLRSYADGCTDEGTKQEIEDFLDEEINLITRLKYVILKVEGWMEACRNHQIRSKRQKSEENGSRSCS